MDMDYGMEEMDYGMEDMDQMEGKSDGCANSIKKWNTAKWKRWKTEWAI